MAGRRHAQADHIPDLLGKGGIARHLEGAQAMRLKPVGFPDALDGSQADADGLGDGASRSMRGGAGRFRTGQCQYFGNHLRRQRRPAGLNAFTRQSCESLRFCIESAFMRL